MLLNSPPPPHVILQEPVILNAGAYFLSKEAALLRTFPRFSRVDIPVGRLPDMYLDTVQELIHPEDWRPFVLTSSSVLLNSLRSDFMLNLCSNRLF